MLKTICEKCNAYITNNNFLKHISACKNRKITKKHIKLATRNWNEIQDTYDNGNLMDVRKKYSLSTSTLARAVNLGLLKTRPRSVSRHISGRDKNPHTPESKEKIRQGMLKAVQEGRQKTPRPYGKYCKHIKYTNWQGEEMMLLGGWEEKVAKYLDQQKISWTRPRNGVRYVYKNQEHYYFPDFYLNDKDLYIEVKGLETERDREKWKQFPFKLAIINKVYIFNLSQFFNNLFGRLAQRLEQRT